MRGGDNIVDFRRGGLGGGELSPQDRLRSRIQECTLNLSRARYVERNQEFPLDDQGQPINVSGNSVYWENELKKTEEELAKLMGG